MTTQPGLVFPNRVTTLATPKTNEVIFSATKALVKHSETPQTVFD